MSFELKEVYPGLFYLQFHSKYECASTFMRIQEYYESPHPELRRQILDLESFMDMYAKYNSNFTYCTDWDGFNIPGYIFRDFFILNYIPLQKKEKELKDRIFEALQGIQKKFYITASYDPDIMYHEVAHGLWYLNAQYQKEMEKLVKEMPVKLRNKFVRILLKLNYAVDMIEDEIQAYCIDICLFGQKGMRRLKYTTYEKKYINKFYRVYKKYFNIKEIK